MIIYKIQIGFYTICLLLSKGFYFYFVLFFSFLYKLFPNKFFYRCINYYKEKRDNPTSFLSFIFYVLLFVFFYVNFYQGKENIHYISNSDNYVVQNKEVENKSFDSSEELNLYRKYSNYDINDISFYELQTINPEVIGWIIVDGTNINYPVVQTNNNSYYLNHDITGNLKGSGWIFMDYRNNSDMSDSNTIIYGHNLLNKTAFGSLSILFTEEWLLSNTHKIMILTTSNQYIYEVFSIYFIDPEVYYLQNNFPSDVEYSNFLDVLVSRSLYQFNVNLSVDDKIITLSTCTDDNKGRKVIHAKKIN